MKVRRNSSFELLRIISMFAIVLHHYAYHGTFNWHQYSIANLPTLRINMIILLFGKLGVDLFVILGAYFLSQKSYSVRRPIKLVTITVFYSFLIFGLLKLLFPKSVDETVSQLLLPIPLPSGYWFVGAYIFMLLCMPAMNLILQKFSMKMLLNTFMILVLFWSVLPTLGFIFPGKPDFTYDVFGNSAGAYFLLLYLIGGIIQRHGLEFLYGGNNLWKMLIIGIIIVVLWMYLCTQNSFLYNHYNIFVLLYNPIDLFLAISIFIFFTRFEFYSKVINEISLSMFGVYLISEDSFIRPILWQHIANSNCFANNWLSYLGNALIVSFLVFTVCIIIDFLIRKLFGKLFDIVSSFLANLVEAH
ncbi:acyltransferase family protein [Limosilactobacillus reuteri]|uniref:acyltransferase family protein n=1 Tax=Limosilactobacillus reuteri TaxID=1598 RepID=UPI000A1FFEAE|nr:acyltransferase family protein [Limosilactobacillus reuteri]UFK64902.1 hypothetical protein IU404_00250 [Limosilactobacillus reuteri]UFK67649.1 hypothetical protein IVR12_00655 [Limosilactobacillus reuteri]